MGAWAYSVSYPEPSLALSSGTLRFPVPLDKGNEDSGNEIGACSNRNVWGVGA